MKTTLRIPTKAQYAYIELESGEDGVFPLSQIAEAVSGYFEASGAYWQAQSDRDGETNAIPGEGLPPREFNACIDEFLLTNNLSNGVDRYGSMSQSQQVVMQEIKKSLKRIKSKNE